MAQIKKRDADMASEEFSTQIVFPEDLHTNPLQSEQTATNVTIVTAKKTDTPVEDLIYVADYLRDDYVATLSKTLRVRNALRKTWRFMKGYVMKHMSHPVLMFMADLTIMFIISTMFIGYTNSVMLFATTALWLLTNKVTIGILTVMALIYIVPSIFADYDPRTPEEKYQDYRLENIIRRARRR